MILTFASRFVGIATLLFAACPTVELVLMMLSDSKRVGGDHMPVAVGVPPLSFFFVGCSYFIESLDSCRNPVVTNFQRWTLVGIGFNGSDLSPRLGVWRRCDWWASQQQSGWEDVCNRIWSVGFFWLDVLPFGLVAPVVV